MHNWGIAVGTVLDFLNHDRSLSNALVSVRIIVGTFFQEVANQITHWGGKRILPWLPEWWPTGAAGTFYVKNTFHSSTMEDGSSITFFDLCAIMNAYEKSRLKFTWCPSDVLFLDNRRFGHSRLAFGGPRR